MLRIQCIYSGPAHVRNTDLRVAREFMEIERFVNDFSFLPMPRLPFLLSSCNFVSNRLFRRRALTTVRVPVKASSCDVVYQYGDYGLFPAFKGDSRPWVITVGFPMMAQELNRSENELQRLADELAERYNNAACFHFHTDASRLEFLKRRPDQEFRCRTIPFFTPYLTVIEENAMESKFNDSRTDIVFVGLQGERKGLPDLCAAVDQIAAELSRRKVRLHIVSAVRPVLERFRNVSHHSFLPRNAVLDLIRRSHIFVMPTRRESYGLVFVEAMASGCATVGDNDLPRREIFGERGGVMVPPRNPERLADELIRLIDNRDQQRQLAREGRKRAKERFVPDVVAGQYEQLFRSLAG